MKRGSIHHAPRSFVLYMQLYREIEQVISPTGSLPAPCATTGLLLGMLVFMLSYMEKYSAWAGPAAVATTLMPLKRFLGCSVLAMRTRA